MLKEKIYEFFESENKTKEYKEQEVNFAPSYINACKRQIYYKKLKIQPSNLIETHAYIKFAMGDSVHEKIQSILFNMGYWQEGEDWKEIIWQDLKWIYRIDAKLKIDDNLYICEIKSSYFSGNKAIEHEAKKEHILQLMMYMVFENIEHGIILYIGRDNGLMYEYHYSLEALKEKYSNFMTNKLKELKDLKEKIENKIVPDRDFEIVLKNNNGDIKDYFQKDNIKHKSDWQCSYCQWKDLCWEKELEEIKNKSFFIEGVFYE